jgi:hypothetical protein
LSCFKGKIGKKLVKAKTPNVGCMGGELGKRFGGGF